MQYPIVFGALGAYLIVLGLSSGGPGLLWCWPGASFLLVALAYLRLGPRVFGKRPDGRLAWWSQLVLLPYLLVTWGGWHLLRLLSREPCCHEVAPGLWVGRRPFAGELPAGTGLVVDLTAEFPATRGVAAGREYVCVPTLDTRAPADAAFTAVVRKVAAWPGTVYVHCASGHGRAPTVAAAALIARGLAVDVAAAELLLQQARPRVRLKRVQRRLVHRLMRPAMPGP